MKKVIVIVKMTSQLNEYSQLLVIAKNLITPTRSETGCLAYELCVDSDNVIYEVITFNNDEAHQEHMASDHVQQFLSDIETLQVSFDVQKI